MELNQAIETVRKLARGIDPQDSEAFGKDSPYNHPDVIRSLYTILEHLPRQKKSIAQRQAENVDKGLPKNTGLPWSDEARQFVAESFQNGKQIDELAKVQERSRTAIVAELHRQGVIGAEKAAELGLVLAQRG